MNTESHNSINSLSLESQLTYINTIKLIDQMSHSQLKEYTELLYRTHLLQQQLLKDTLKQNLIDTYSD